MLKEDAIQLSQDLVTTKAQHCNYTRTVELANKYRALITGENADFLMEQFVRREDDAAFEQRLRLTISITPAVCGNIIKPFNKALRNNKVKKSYDFKTATRNEIVKKMDAAFYGRAKSKNKGLDYWIRMRYTKLSFLDPNAWVVTEWTAPETAAAIIKPRPFEVSSEMAWNFNIENDEVKWLEVHECITFKKIKQTRGQKIADARAAGEYTEEEGEKFTLYDEDYTVVNTQVDKNYLTSSGYKYAPNETLWEDKENKAWYIMAVYEPKLGFVPAFRVGYEPDDETKGATCVNAFHIALPYLMKSIKTNSEMDLSMALHAFPQKLQYVQKCPGMSKTRRCDGGRDGDGAICKKCNGSGIMVHSSAQDALFFPMPSTKEEMMDLDQMLVYKTPPTDLLAFQKAWIEYLTQQCTNVMFSQNQQTKTASPQPSAAGAGGGGGTITATETNKNMQGYNDALYPFTEKVSEVWISEIYTFGRLAGTPDAEEVDVVCIFPADLKLKSVDDLLQDRKTAVDAGAPAFVIIQIDDDIAEQIYMGDELAEKMYKTKRQFYPFNGQTPDEVAMLVSSQYVSEFSKVLYCNYEAIFADIDMDDPEFWFYDLNKQWDIVEAMVETYREELKTTNALSLQLPGGGGDTPPAADDPAGDGITELKPGDPGYVDPATETEE